METILAHAQELVSTLSSLMPTPYQKDNLEAMLALSEYAVTAFFSMVAA